MARRAQPTDTAGTRPPPRRRAGSSAARAAADEPAVTGSGTATVEAAAGIVVAPDEIALARVGQSPPEPGSGAGPGPAAGGEDGGALVFRLRERAGDEWGWDVLTVDADGTLRPTEGGLGFKGPLEQYARLVYGLASTCTVTATTEALFRELVDALALLDAPGEGDRRRGGGGVGRRLRLVPPDTLPQTWQRTVGGPKLPVVPGPFRDGLAPVPANHVTFALNQAIQHAGSGAEWSDHDGRTVPTHLTRTNKGKGAVYVSLRGADGTATPAPEALPALWARVRALSDTTSDALLVCLAMAERHGAGPSASVWVTADAILDARGIKRKRYAHEPGNWQHGHRREDRLEAGRALSQLQNLWLRVESVQVTSGRKGAKPRTLTMDSRALAILDKLGQQELDGGEVFLAARVAFGEWAGHYWEAGLRQVALLTQKALSYDPYRQQVEKRLAKYLAFHFRFDGAGEADDEDAAGARELHRTVDTLLTEAALAPEKTNPQRTRDRLEKALDQLRADGVIGAWRYKDDPDGLPARQWVPVWRRLSVSLTPPVIPSGRGLPASRLLAPPPAAAGTARRG